MNDKKKEESNPDQNLEVSFSLLNYLRAGYQGKFAALNILAQLGYNKLDTQDTENLRVTLDEINEWMQTVWRGEHMFTTYWKKAETRESFQAVKYFEVLQEDLRKTADEIVDIFELDSLSGSSEEVKFLIANFGRGTYSQDNYVRGYIEYGERHGKEEMVSDYKMHLDDINEDISFAHTLMKTFKESEEQDVLFYQTLVQATVTLPGTFRSQVHDINILISPLTGGMSFERAGIDNEAAKRWVDVGSNPVEAGYWAAFDVTPEEAVNWIKAGVPDHTSAALWKAWGLAPQVAAPWHHEKFPPIIAIKWLRAGFDALSALQYIEQGILEPSEIPPDASAQTTSQSEDPESQDD